MQQSKLFQILPDYICTPDGMAIDREGNLVPVSYTHLTLPTTSRV